ncbi:Myb-like protein L [Echinococcus granulosus]|uniref:Myb-like protein L n=1 Tax=Echinococcus granulosus TaxID=6210 RepID=W6UUF2_ECHGR|nr:Myb-like protein L [Echinococcus granulosus]EUB57009.1 Myb-like protein L [Echinococcus granulosus]
MDCGVNSSHGCLEISDKEAAVRCIVLNETSQGLIKETVSCIEAEIALLRKEVGTCSLCDSKQTEPPDSDKVTDASYMNAKSNYVNRPFFRTEGNDCPPMNVDTQTRLRLKETNVADDLNATLHKLTQSETIKLLLALVDCYRISLQRKLNEQVEILTESLTHLDKSFSEREQIFLKLQSAEKRLNHSKSILPTALPKEIVTCIASLSNTINESVYWYNKFDKFAKSKQSGAKDSSISMTEWISILNNAHNVLTDNDWNYISVHVLKSVKSAKFCRLYWLHRLRPELGRGLWSSDELAALERAVGELGPYGQWQQISERLSSGRTAFSCFKAWHKHLNPQHPSRAPWSPDEDESLDLIVDDELFHECKAISLVDWGVVSARIQTRSAIACQRRYYELHQLTRSSPKAPFSPEEDLALLIAIQRLGTGGGLYGWGNAGENPGTLGTWSVIAAELPGGRRTAKECELRHNELCEKFQPWTYAETRRLFQFSSRVSETTNNETGPFIAVNILPYFPGRAMSALLNRLRSCRTLASVLKRLRRFPNQNVLVDDFFSSTDFEPLRPHLFDSQSIFGEWIRELRQLGVLSPEGYAFSRLLAWRPRKPYEAPEGQRHSFKVEMNYEFNQLLLDLEEGLLLPSKSELSTTNSGISAADISTQPSSSSGEQLNVLGVARLINSYQLKPALFALLSSEIARRMNQPIPDVPSLDQDRGDGKRKIKPLTHNINEDASASVQEIGERLLKDRNFFTRVFERVLSSNDTASQAYSSHNPRVLDLMAPELASDMLFFAQQCDGDNSLDPSKSRSHESKHVIKSIPRAKLQRILQIRQILLRCRVPSIRSGSLKTPWAMPFTEVRRTDHNQGGIPFFAQLPDPLQKQLGDFSNWVTDTVITFVSKRLGVSCSSVEGRRNGPHIRLDRGDLSIKLLPPNLATISALKVLLMKLPELQKTAGGNALRVLRSRVNCNFFDRSSAGSVAIPSDAQLDPVIRDQPDVAALLSSSKHRIFVLRCLALFLWPCLLANMRARDFVDRSLAILWEQSRKLVKVGSAAKRLRPPANTTSSKRDLKKNDLDVGVPPRKRYLRAERLWSHSKFPDSWMHFTVDCDASLNVYCELPATVEDLLRTGFVPSGFCA